LIRIGLLRLIQKNNKQNKQTVNKKRFLLCLLNKVLKKQNKTKIEPSIERKHRKTTNSQSNSLSFSELQPTFNV